jgi:hypothetical protein
MRARVITAVVVEAEAEAEAAAAVAAARPPVLPCRFEHLAGAVGREARAHPRSGDCARLRLAIGSTYRVWRLAAATGDRDGYKYTRRRDPCDVSP